MSAKENPCRKFQANIFNKSKCQNCFRPRESHLLDDEDFAQANPIYGGWLLLAPDGTNFENPLHRSRKWQRRFFLLYEHGLLRYALDEMTSTLPQGIINLNVCVDVVDGESTTGHKHSLCICTPDQEHYIRAESKEVITGWQEALIVFPRTNKQNQKKKRKVEPPSSQVCTHDHLSCLQALLFIVLKQTVGPPKVFQFSCLDVLLRKVMCYSSFSSQPDLLNFKKGWMTKLYEDGVWKKHWFVLTDQSLRYYRDSIAEEAADLDGEIDLSTCYDVTEFPVQRNYGFQIHSKDGVFTLSAMTSGIRRNWIQAMMKSVRPTITPDVTRCPTPEISQTTHTPKVEVQRSCDVTGDSASPHEQRKTRVRDRRREGRSKTFDWAEFRPGQAKEEPERPTRERVETLDINGQRQRPLEEPQGQAHDRPQMEVDSAAGVGGVSGPRGGNEKPDVQVEIEQRWHQVETTPLREEKQVPIIGSAAHLSPGDRTPPQELAARLDKELGQTQRELARLQEENSHLHEQLQDARSREHSARVTLTQETCERGFAAMEHTHQKVIEDLQRQHQREINKLLEERERLLEEETHATIAAIEAMKNAHREELEKSQRAQLSGVSADIEQLHTQYEEELQSIHRELEVLSEQYSQKCLENAHLVQALEAERQALQQCQRENQQLHTHNQELNNRLTVEITRMRSCFSGEKTGSLTQGKDLYELEVLLRIKESEIQYLKQEINSLKDELQSALRDKKYACDKYKDIYRELSIVRAKADCDITKLREKLLAATEALDERETDRGAVTTGYDIMKSKSNPDLLKNERSSLSKPTRGVRSKVRHLW
uniref:PH domain-containing protein n=1 Tax=Electrophorus electricus TaxID=8005 RepID=A0A4W4FDX6_ELEEL